MAVKQYYQQEQAKKRQSIDNSMIRFPKLDECAHFHFEYAELNNFHVSLIINENGASRQASNDEATAADNCLTTNIRNLYLFVRVQSQNNRSWTIRRNLQDFRFLDIQLHKCVFDRKHSKLQPLNLTYFSSSDSLESILHFVAQYLERLSQIVGGCFLTCGPILHWFEIDNRGNRLINEESDINTPAIGAAFVIKKHNKNEVETEISLEIGELVSVIEMPPVNESFYWKGKKGFETGWFPAQCVQLIDDKISKRKTEELPLRPLEKCISPTLRAHDSNSSAHLEETFAHSNHIDLHHPHYRQSSVMRKHGLIAALFRSFASNNKRRDQLRSSGILKERVFGCDLCEHLANSGHDLPLVLTACCAYIEAHGLSSNGIYRLSGVASTIHRLRAIFDEDRSFIKRKRISSRRPIPTGDIVDSAGVDIHAVSSLLKLFFRELPNPLLTFSLYDDFVAAMRDETMDDSTRLQSIRTLVISLPPPHWRTLRFLTRHLSYVSKFESKTGMTPKNLAIVWAPNLLRSRDLDQHVGIEALHVIGTQAVLTEFLILNCDKIFDREEHELHPVKSLYSPFIYSKHANSSSYVSSKCLKYIDVGPHNIRTRPSLFGEEAIINSGGNFRKLANFDGKTSSESTNNFNALHKAVGSRLSARISKSVKRSQSFDSYFKKLRASSSSCSNTKCSSEQSEDGNRTIVDINRNQFEQLSKNDTIFEEEEMSIDCDNLVEEGSKLRGDLHNNIMSEVNNNLLQIEEEKLQENAVNTNCSTSSSNDQQQQQQDSTQTEELIPTNAQPDDDQHLEQQCSFETKSSLIPTTKSAPVHTSPSAADSQLVTVDSATDGTDTHSPTASTPTQLTTPGSEGQSPLEPVVTPTAAAETDSSSSSSADNPPETHKSLDAAEPTPTAVVLPQAAVEDDSARELIERIKEERRNQIRQNFLQQLASAQSKTGGEQQQLTSSPSSRIPVANRTGGNHLPEVSNSSDPSPVRLRNKSHCLSNSAWRNSEATMNDSAHISSVPARQSIIAKYRRSVPNLDSSSTRTSTLSVVEQTRSSLNKDANVKYRRPPIVSSISVDETAGKSPVNSATNRTRITVTPLSRVYNKRQRIIDPKTLAQMFEQQNSPDDV
ncbi:Rho GTPase-activating protein 32 [Tyrophagus putrescentiae]|nr:Rho GTPase-activating protein 32 [Tyrophagus putrescentiae]